MPSISRFGKASDRPPHSCARLLTAKSTQCPLSRLGIYVETPPAERQTLLAGGATHQMRLKTPVGRYIVMLVNACLPVAISPRVIAELG